MEKSGIVLTSLDKVEVDPRAALQCMFDTRRYPNVVLAGLDLSFRIMHFCSIYMIIKNQHADLSLYPTTGKLISKVIYKVGDETGS